MPIIAKALVGVFCVASVGVGAVGITRLMVSEPKASTISEVDEHLPEGKWWSEGEHRKHLVADDAKNQTWWNWKYRTHYLSFRRRQEQNIHESFMRVNRGYSGEDIQDNNFSTSLNKACRNAYTKDKVETKDKANTNHTLETNIKDFCYYGKLLKKQK